MNHGGKLLIDQLEALGTAAIYMVPGESFLAALDGLYDNPRVRAVTCRHEGAAAMMAQSSAKLTGRPGVAFVTRGPGAANAVSGIYIANEDETPMILLVGLPPAGLSTLRPFQAVDLTGLFPGLAKWTAIVERTSDIPAFLLRAFHIAQSGRPGPVILGLPQDILDGPTDVAPLTPDSRVEAAPSREAMAELEARLAEAQSPFMIVGGPGWSERVKTQFEAFALRFDLPVATSFRCQDYFDNRHPSYVGHLGFGLNRKLASGLRIADLLIVAGAPLGEVTTSANTLIVSPRPRQSLVHIHPSPEEIGRYHKSALAIVSSASAFGAALRTIEPPASKPWKALRRDLRAALEASRKPDPATAAAAPDGCDETVDFSEVIAHLSKILPDDAIITNGAGNYAQFLHRYFAYKSYPACLAPACGSMGYGLPAAIAAKLAYPERMVVCLAGDGCLMMTLPDLATAVQYGLNIIIIVANNGLYGTIRMHQERAFPGRVVGTTLINPHFAALARSFGASGERVNSIEDFVIAFERAATAEGPALIELMLDADAVAPGQSLSGPQ